MPKRVIKKVQIRMTRPTILAPSFCVSHLAIFVASPVSSTSCPKMPPIPRIRNQEVTKPPAPPENVVRRPSDRLS